MMETSVFSAKELLANCSGSNCAVEELNVSFQVYQLLCVPSYGTCFLSLSVLDEVLRIY